MISPQPFNPFLSSGQALLDAIPKRAEAALACNAVPLPTRFIVSVATLSGHMVAWTVSIAFSRDIRVRVACIENRLSIGYDSSESLELLRAVLHAGHMQSFAYNNRIGRWVPADY